MKQMLHIFAKDTRRLRLEIFISLALTTALVVLGPHLWRADEMVGHAYSSFWLTSDGPKFLAGLIHFLIPVSWWLMISPLIHAERLVGDRQFWLTRPYEWPKLLAAKLLFVVVFIVLPLLLAQCLLLVEAGFAPIPSIPGLLFDLLLMTCFILLPLLALATMTSNFGRMALALLGLWAFLAAVFLVVSNLWPDKIELPYADIISWVLIVCAFISVIVLQYARRRAKAAWIILVSVFVVVALFGSGEMPSPPNIGRTYPVAAGQSSPIDLSYQVGGGVAPSVGVGRSRDVVGINIPIHVSGVADGTVEIPEYMQVSLVTPDGSRWASKWLRIYMYQFMPGELNANASFNMPRAVYEKFKSTPLNAQVTYALTQATEDDVFRVSLPNTEFSVPGFGICAPLTGLTERPDDIDGIACRAPLRKPVLTMVHVVWSNQPCNARTADPDEVVQGTSWQGDLDRGPADFGISPIWSQALPISNSFKSSAQAQAPRHMCPGTPVTFTRYKMGRRTQAPLSIQGLQLPELSGVQSMMIEGR